MFFSFTINISLIPCNCENLQELVITHKCDRLTNTYEDSFVRFPVVRFRSIGSHLNLHWLRLRLNGRQRVVCFLHFLDYIKQSAVTPVVPELSLTFFYINFIKISSDTTKGKCRYRLVHNVKSTVKHNQYNRFYSPLYLHSILFAL